MTTMLMALNGLIALYCHKKIEGFLSICVETYLLHMKGALAQNRLQRNSVFFSIKARISFEYCTQFRRFQTSKQVLYRLTGCVKKKQQTQRRRKSFINFFVAMRLHGWWSNHFQTSRRFIITIYSPSWLQIHSSHWNVRTGEHLKQILDSLLHIQRHDKMCSLAHSKLFPDRFRLVFERLKIKICLENNQAG